MPGITRSFYGKVFLMFSISLLTLYVFNQSMITWFGSSEVRKIFIERQLAQNLSWSQRASLPEDTDALKFEMLNSMRGARQEEVMIFSAPLETATSTINERYLLPDTLGDIKITPSSTSIHFPLISQALVEFNGERWDATRLIAADRIIVSLINKSADDRSIEEFMNFRARMVRQIMPITLLLAIGCAFFLSRRVLAPTLRIQKSLREIDYHDLRLRVPTRGEDKEFIEFIHTFNDMLARLEKGFLQTSRFSSDAAHELRTPLTIMQGYVERLINEAAPASHLQTQLCLIADEIERLTSITDKLLLLAQADAGRLQMDFQIVNVSDMLDEIRSDSAMLDPPLELRGRVQKNLLLRTDRVLFQQMLNNLFSNAVKYNEPDGWIEISAWATADKLHVRFANASQPLSEEFIDKVFDRFSRADTSRSRRIDGTGLGLSLCREIALANNGELTLNVDHHRQVVVEFVAPLHTDDSTQPKTEPAVSA